MNIFASLKKYAGKWNVTNERSFTQEEQDAIQEAAVVDSQYGLSVCFFMKGGGQTFIPLDTHSTLGIGDTVDLKSAKLLTLHRDGDTDIYRVSI